MGGRSFASFLILLVFGGILLGAGCGGGNSSGSVTPTQLRVLQASPSESDMNVFIDGSDVTTVKYGAATSFLTVSSGSRHVQIEPVGTSTAVVDTTINFNSGDSKTLIVDNVSPNVSGTVLINQNTTPATGDFTIRAVNASLPVEPVDVYVLASGSTVGGTSPSISSLAFGSASDYQSLTAGNYQVIFTYAGTKIQMVGTGSMNLTAGQVRTIVVVNQLGGGFEFLPLPDLN